MFKKGITNNCVRNTSWHSQIAIYAKIVSFSWDRQIDDLRREVSLNWWSGYASSYLLFSKCDSKVARLRTKGLHGGILEQRKKEMVEGGEWGNAFIG